MRSTSRRESPAYDRVFGHLDYDAMVRDSRGVFGGPETCARILKRIIEVVGTTHIGLTFHFGGLSQDKVLKSMERCAQFGAAGAALDAFSSARDRFTRFHLP